MFLNILNEKEAEKFLDLAYLSMHVNGIVHDSEESVFETFRRETGLFNYKCKDTTYEKLVEIFNGCTKRTRRAAYVEIVGILDADGQIDDKGKEWVEQLGKDLNFRDTEIKKMIRWVEDFNDLLQEGYDYINKR